MTTPKRALAIGDADLWLFSEGNHTGLGALLGAHGDPSGGFMFRVWAPSARGVDVVGDFNGWRGGVDAMTPIGSSGIWERRVAAAERWQRYKYRIRTADGRVIDKADPVGALHEQAPATASVVFESGHVWTDGAWRRRAAKSRPWSAPVSIYEVHLGSWRRPPDNDDTPLYRAIAEPLARYVSDLGYTHVELLPVMEHPFYGSWGYQVTGYFAPTSRYGSPDDLRFLVDTLHRHGVGVIFDWVPAHFPNDPHGLAEFDGSHLYEHADPRQGWHPDWNTCIFNLGRNEVRAFLLSSAMYWLDELHGDGLRVDAVASMLYLDYSRAEGEWIPNVHGGNENLESIAFLRTLNEQVHARHPHALMIAEESTAWPGVSRPTSVGGLGFGFKWDMGWMHDTLKHLARDPIHRRHHHDEVTFRAVYASSENFVLALSHDEVVHGKGSLPSRMPGDEWQKYANVRLLLGYQLAQPGKKLVFMGMEIAQWHEWSHEQELSWGTLGEQKHGGVQRLVGALNRLYRKHAALHRRELESDATGWDQQGLDAEVSVIARYGDDGDPPIIAVCNFTPTRRDDFRVGVPWEGRWREALSTDAEEFGGSGVANRGLLRPGDVAVGAHARSVTITLPPLGATFLVPWGYRGAK
ncbi:MAG: 1,4-alpha-glucan branching protein GlgB [Myxococcales bacterium]|nr:1,4-alpha-glucan branching protein GlgB [Myxococcales bacterium]